MKTPLIFAALAATMMPAALFAPIAAPAFAKPPVVSVVTIRMAHRGFHPQVIRLKGGQRYRLRFINSDRTEHDFYAPDFFANARLEPGAMLDNGRLNVRGGNVRTITLTPASGHYQAKSSKALDVVSNMTAQILVY
ncbi:MAG TPA: cupredoxin domain-containing protein [Sphingomonas sp.]